MDTDLSVIVEMLRNPPSLDEPLPLSNRLPVVIGVVTPFLVCRTALKCHSQISLHLQVLSLLAVGLRLFIRISVAHQPGWDDAFVFLAAVANVVAQSAFLNS